MDLPNGLNIWVEDRSEVAFLYEEIFETQIYLPELVNLSDGSVIFDVGANIGLASVFFSKECHAASVLAIEPVPTSFSVLEANFKLHQIKGSATCCALSHSPGSAVFTHYPRASAKSGLYPDPVVDQLISRIFLQDQGFPDADIEWVLRRKFAVETIPVACRTLSEIITESGVAYVDLLKLDVEKSELDVLHGVTREHWKAGKIRQLVVEVHDIDGRLLYLKNLLKRYGYRVDISDSPNVYGHDMYIMIALLG